MQILISIIEVILVTVPALLIVAFTTVAERKTMASMQRRLGPNYVGFYGSLQAFADALKLLLKEYVAPTQSNKILFFIAPIVTLIFSLLGYAVIPFGAGLVIGDMDLGILFSLAVSSLSTYGILLAGWSANSKYAFLGSLRSTAQLISYELILSSAILLVILFTSSLNLTANVESQKGVYSVFPLLPMFIIFFIGAIAETNRAPFDLAEAESELVSGFMTEHSSVVFVFFFLAEYASIVLICMFTSILFLGGYILVLYGNYDVLADLINMVGFSHIWQGLINSLTLGFKACFLVFSFIWIRASFPRARFDQLMSYGWTSSLPIIIGIVIFMPCVMYYFSILPCTIYPYLQQFYATDSPWSLIIRSRLAYTMHLECMAAGDQGGADFHEELSRVLNNRAYLLVRGGVALGPNPFETQYYPSSPDLSAPWYDCSNGTPLILYKPSSPILSQIHKPF